MAVAWAEVPFFSSSLSPIKNTQRGEKLLNEGDHKGKLFRKEIVELAKTKGLGLVDYTCLNPVTKQEEPKTTYIQKMGNLIIRCGVHKGSGND